MAKADSALQRKPHRGFFRVAGRATLRAKPRHQPRADALTRQAGLGSRASTSGARIQPLLRHAISPFEDGSGPYRMRTGLQKPDASSARRTMRILTAFEREVWIAVRPSVPRGRRTSSGNSLAASSLSACERAKAQAEATDLLNPTLEPAPTAPSGRRMMRVGQRDQRGHAAGGGHRRPRRQARGRGPGAGAGRPAEMVANPWVEERAGVRHFSAQSNSSRMIFASTEAPRPPTHVPLQRRRAGAWPPPRQQGFGARGA